MQEAAARNLRTAERFLLAPPLAAEFGAAPVAICDISARGARLKHGSPLETGRKSILRLAVEGRPSAVALEAVVVWTQADSGAAGRFVSGIRTYGPDELVSGLLTQLQTSKRTTRIEEMRSADRFVIAPALPALWNDDMIRIEDLSTRGARIETVSRFSGAARGTLRFHVPAASITVAVDATVVWSRVKAIESDNTTRHCAGLLINEKPELLRLAIGHLCETGRASLDAHSLSLKVKILRARARDLAPELADHGPSGVPAEQYLLIQGVREELRLNPEEALLWYRRARIAIADPATRALAPAIADHPDAIAVWEYLDRTIDPTMIGRTLELPRRED
jgi:hypothetical protein